MIVTFKNFGFYKKAHQKRKKKSENLAAIHLYFENIVLNCQATYTLYKHISIDKKNWHHFMVVEASDNI